MTQRHFFLEGKYYGAAVERLQPRHGAFIFADGIAHFCPHCARVWAHSPVDGLRTYPRTVSCENCPSLTPWLPSGLLTLPLEPIFNDQLPQPLLQRDFFLLLNFYESHPHVE